MPKIETFDAGTFWKNAYAHQRGKLLKKVSVPDDQIIEPNYVDLGIAVSTPRGLVVPIIRNVS